ncbi:hypothetical protein [Deinococcus hohokamensis]|uniref:Uncharacterized protein n=1 Tax=Deinococcus hohokamensis TaxID=309883 RepID=A0ABV9ICS2_9DEIO
MSAVDSVTPPSGTQTPSGFLCVAAPGLVSRLSALPTCTYNGATVPCFTVQRGTTRRDVVVAASGQTEVQ